MPLRCRVHRIGSFHHIDELYNVSVISEPIASVQVWVEVFVLQLYVKYGLAVYFLFLRDFHGRLQAMGL